MFVIVFYVVLSDDEVGADFAGAQQRSSQEGVKNNFLGHKPQHFWPIQVGRGILSPSQAPPWIRAFTENNSFVISEHT